MSRKLIFVNRSMSIVHEAEVDSRGRCDPEKAALHLILRGVNSGFAAEKLRVFVEDMGTVRTDVAKLVSKMRDRLTRDCPVKDLSHRQKEVGARLVRFQTNKEIANELHITERTVKFHVSILLRKFGCSRRLELGQKMALVMAGVIDADNSEKLASLELEQVRPN